ncbi:MAG: hypothetical protein K8R58_09620 [Bacteroidales bacterium]|nr:hypothetical protein [Bacteroidales bacterium]
MEKKETIKAVTFILSGALLQIFNGIGGGWATHLISIFGLILFLIGLNKLKKGLDSAGQGAVQMLFIGVILGLVGIFFDLIPLMGWLAIVLYIVAFVFELIGFIKLKKSTTIGEIGKSGAGLLVIALILLLVACIFWFIPLIGGIFVSILSLAALFLAFYGWVKIQAGIIGEDATQIKSVTFILIGTLLLLANTATSGWAPALASLFGLFLLFKGFKQLNDNIDAVGQSAIKLLIISIFIGIAASLLDIVASIMNIASGDVIGMMGAPDTFDIIVVILFAATFVVQFIGYLKLKKSSSIGEVGKSGVLFLMISMIVVAIGSLIGIIPFTGIITSIFAIAGLVLILFGWVKVQEGLIEKT